MKQAYRVHANAKLFRVYFENVRVSIYRAKGLLGKRTGLQDAGDVAFSLEVTFNNMT